MTINFNAFTSALAAAAILITTGAVNAKETPNKRPLKVIILAGQSNMQKPAKWHTLKGLADSPETKPLYDKLVDADGKVRTHKDIYETLFEFKRISRWKSEPLPPRGAPLPGKFAGKVLGVDEDGGNYGPELGFGVTLYEQVQEPILIIKTAWGGKSLHSDFRPPIAEDWTPPKDHPDHPDNAPKPLPIPVKIELPDDFQPPSGRGKNCQIAAGLPVEKMNGVHPIYVLEKRTGGKRRETRKELLVLEEGDLIIGLNGQGLGENPIAQWRKTWFKDVQEGDWMLEITFLRDSKIMTATVDTAQYLECGRAGLKEYVAEREAEQAAKKKKLSEDGGVYYNMMLERIREVLADPGKFHPAYDPGMGYEIAGFVWFQGFNDQINGSVYPNRLKPRGFEQYSWLLAHLIRNVRKDLNAPEMPVVIGTFGQGGQNGNPHPLAEAQAAVAGFDEFKGTVAAVRTLPFRDPKIPEFQSRLDRVMAYDGGDPKHPFAKMQTEVKAFKEKMGDPSALKNKGERNALETKINAGIDDIIKTQEEQNYLPNNVSNAGYHYNGSPKFFVRAGEAFALSLHGLMTGGK